MYKHLFLRSSAIAIALAAAGCGGGGNSTSVLPRISQPTTSTTTVPDRSAMNVATAYSVYVGTTPDGSSAVDTQPLGAPSVLAGAVAAPGAIVAYPDGSTQTADVLGNFDAGAASWSALNLDAISANPNLSPTVAVSAGSALPQDVAVNVYAPGGATQLASAAVHILDAERGTEASASTAELGGLVVLPTTAAMFSGEKRLFYAVGADATGARIALAANVTWSVKTPKNCPAALGSVRAIADGSKAIYSAPPSGATSPACADLVTASVTSPVSVHASAGAANVFDRGSAVMIAGTLTGANAKPLAKTSINLYGGSAEAARGNQYIGTDANGAFRAKVAANRLLAPLANVSDGAPRPHIVVTAIAPASLNPAALSEAARLAQKWTSTGAAAHSATVAQAPFERVIRDASYLGNIARENFPFGVPAANGTFAAGSLEATINKPVANSKGAFTAGPYAGWTFAVGADARTTTAVSPNRKQLLVVTSAAAQSANVACPAGSACFGYVRYASRTTFDPQNPLVAGAILEIDGSWSQKIVSPNFNVTLARNEYSASRQTPGSPQYSHVATIVQTLGSVNATLSDAWKTGTGAPLGSLSIARTAGSGPVLYTYAGSASRNIYQSGSKFVRSEYSISSGTENADRSGSFVASATSASDQSAKVNYTFTAPAAVAASNTIATGTIDAKTAAATASGHAAAFSIAPSGAVTLTKDATLAGVTSQFQL